MERPARRISREIQPLRVLIVDDQPAIRQALRDLLADVADIQVVAEASDGDEGLRLVHTVQPDAVLLDLEMPRMDGFTFLRLLMAKRPTPVVVVSSHATRESVFRALELGAMEFVTKPTRVSSLADLQPIREDLLHKVRLVRSLSLRTLAERTRAQRVLPRPTPVRTHSTEDVLTHLRSSAENSFLPGRLLCIGASTGGPPAILSLLQSLDPRLPVAVLVTQHMPDQFTHGFVERLRRATNWKVREATPGEAVAQGEVLVAPSNSSLRVGREGPFLFVHEPLEHDSDTRAPSIDLMFRAAADAMRERVLAVLLTGHAGDGVEGARAVRAAGGKVIVESPDSAVISALPEDAIRAGAVDEVISLRRMPETLTRLILQRQNRPT